VRLAFPFLKINVSAIKYLYLIKKISYFVIRISHEHRVILLLGENNSMVRENIILVAKTGIGQSATNDPPSNSRHRES